MNRGQTKSRHQKPLRTGTSGGTVLACAVILFATASSLHAQNAPNNSVEERVEQLTEAMTKTQALIDQSQRQMQEIRDQLTALQRQMANTGDGAVDSLAAKQLADEVARIREQQDVQQSQIASHEQMKVESASKYPVKLSGLVLLNGFVNTGNVDVASAPTISIPGQGSTGASVRQTVLGLDATGPHLFGARSHADVRIDFGGGSPSTNYSGTGTYNGHLLRLRTAHAGLEWDHAETYFSYDRPLIVPNTPTSLTAVVVPALAWSGNLWVWTPQIGFTYDMSAGHGKLFQTQVALIEASDPPVISGVAATTAEMSRWPGVESRLSLLGSTQDTGFQMGVGGYFAPHRTAGGKKFDAWAGTLDARLPLPQHMELTGNFYRGQALGGLGGGAFKDVVYDADLYEPGTFDARALNDVGGWAQLKQRLNERFEFNVAFGMDDVPAGQLRPSSASFTTAYQELARNRTFSGNVIFSPSAYLLFSLEYRRLNSSPVNGPTSATNIIGIAAGYKF